MTGALGLLYHWAPAGRRASILAFGLRPGSDPTCCTAPARWVCLSPSASAAWSLSGAVFPERAELWDLWQVQLDAGDQVHIRPMHGAVIEEVQVHGRIPAARCWWVGQRPVATG